MNLKNTTTCVYCAACTGSACLLNFKIGYYAEGEYKVEKSVRDTEAVYCYPKESCFKPLNKDAYVEALKIRNK